MAKRFTRSVHNKLAVSSFDNVMGTNLQALRDEHQQANQLI